MHILTVGNMQIHVCPLESGTMRNKETLNVNDSYTVEELKAKIQDKVDIPCDQQHLIYNGTHLEDFKTLYCYGICEGSNISVLKQWRYIDYKATHT